MVPLGEWGCLRSCLFYFSENPFCMFHYFARRSFYFYFSLFWFFLFTFLCIQMNCSLLTRKWRKCGGRYSTWRTRRLPCSPGVRSTASFPRPLARETSRIFGSLTSPSPRTLLPRTNESTHMVSILVSRRGFSTLVGSALLCFCSWFLALHAY